ncbi:hypothetical protein KZO01_25850 [Kurthia zopfii]|nr:hypothetical protein KZO01_25850 [Kurthia zopfii]
MATKSTSYKSTIWSIIALIIAVLSLTYCTQTLFGSPALDTTTILAKLKMLGANMNG